MSEKVALCVMYISSFITCFVLAYIRSWRLALALSSILPCTAVAAALMNNFVSKYMLWVLIIVHPWHLLTLLCSQSLKHISDGGSIAEEVISTVRTAHAFGTQDVLCDIFNGRVEKSRHVELKAAISNGMGLGFFFFIVYSCYALAFSYGTTLIIRGLGECCFVCS